MTLDERLYQAGAAWLAQSSVQGAASRSARLQSLERFRALGLPSKRDEAWRYLPHRRVFRDALAGSLANGSTPEANAVLAASTMDLPFAHRLVLVDGRFTPALSTEALPAGVQLETGAALEGDPIWLAARVARAGREADGVAALGAALAPEDLMLRITGTPPPIAIVHLTTASGEAPIVSSALLVHLEAGAGVQLLQVFIGGSHSSALSTHQTIIRLEEGSSIEETKVANAGPSASALLRTEAELAPRARFLGHQFLLRGGVLRSEIAVSLGEEARAVLSGLALARGDGHAEHELCIHHRAPKSESEQLYKTIASERGHTAFSGRVVVDEVARGSVAHQTNRNLLLSREAEVDTRPQLEIYAKEVEASHGATVGQLEEEQLFYLASRGLDAEFASALLRAAFVEESSSRLSDPALRAWVRGQVFSALGVPAELSEVAGGSLDLD